MNKLLTALAVAAFACSGSAMAQTLTIGNGSASDITAIYISDSGTDNWEENIIEGYKLPAGNQVNIEIPGTYESFDLRVEAGEASEDYTEYPGNTTQILLKGGGQSEFK